MKKNIFLLLIFFVSICGCLGDNEYFMKAEKLKSQGLFKDALTNYRFLLAPQKEYRLNGDELRGAIYCITQLNDISQFDALVENAVAAHPESTPLLLAAANAYISVVHDGFFINDKFKRGYGNNQNGRYVNSFSRDRVRALQLYFQTWKLINNPREPGNVIDMYGFFCNFAAAMRYSDQARSAWKLQFLTDLTRLPDYDEQQMYMYRGFSPNQNGAPVTADGAPLFYQLPKSLESAANDGERWRWLLEKSADAGNNIGPRLIWADFLRSQFGVQTMTGLRGNNAEFTREDGPFAVRKLTDDETIARLANGIKRFKLPDEFNYITIYRELAGKDFTAMRMLVSCYMDRCQYNRAVELLQKTTIPAAKKYAQTQQKEITDDTGFFLPLEMQPSGAKASVKFKYRNAANVKLSLDEIDVKALLTDIRKKLKDNPVFVDQGKISPDNIGYRLVVDNDRQYLGKTIETWNVPLVPGNDHYDKVIDVRMPEVKSGAYLLKAELPGGYKCYTVLWLSDIVILRKIINDKVMFFAADALCGDPVANAEFRFFGYKQQPLESPRVVAGSREKKRFDVICREFTLKSDRDGMVFCNDKNMSQEYCWMVEAVGANDKYGVMGFSNLWYESKSGDDYSSRKIYGFTDRPVYRPGQKGYFNAWGAWAVYSQNNVNPFAGTPVNIRIADPQDQEILTRKIKADRFGGVNGEFKLPEKATLGVYSVQLSGNGYYGYYSFRVEEYKKPEFDVKVNVPAEPLRLGDKFKIGINARYYWGAPVAEGTVKYKVERQPMTEIWFPSGPWQWLYGRGYWWQGVACKWLPGWNDWRCIAPMPPWLPSHSMNRTELVSSGEAALDPNGNFDVMVDTNTVRRLLGEVDSKYLISAEVTDRSRRMISGDGSVIVAAKPFNVYCWTNRGYYTAGESVRVQIVARSIDGLPVECDGTARLYLINYDHNGKPEEQLISSFDLDKTAKEAVLKFKIDKQGQYRLHCTMTDVKKQKVESGYVFMVIGEKDKDAPLVNVRFNPLELICDRQEYKSGDTLNLMINADKENATVVLLNYSSAHNVVPEVLHLTGKQMIKEIKIQPGDMPNFFIEAYTVADGKVHQAITQVVVPPEKKILNIEVLPAASRLSPGDETSCRLKITDQRGTPVSGAVVVTVYDRALEYIAPDNYPDIRKFFWEWVRTPYTSHMSNIRRFYNLLPKGEKAMSQLGCFGYITPLLESGDEEADGVDGDMDTFKAMNGRAMPAMAPMAKMEAGSGAGAATSTPPPVKIRSDFADTAFWSGKLIADREGIVNVKFKMPENLTAWKIRAWAMTENTSVGQGEAEVITAKDFMVRLQMPRFMVTSDKACFSAIVHSYLDGEKRAAVSLNVDGKSLKLNSPADAGITIKSGGESRVDWVVEALSEGNAVVTVKAIAPDGVADAMKLDIPVVVHGASRQVSLCGSIPADSGKSAASIKFVVPADRRPDETTIQVNYSPTVAGAIIDALPYLSSYPYGCTEQTLNRFLPLQVVKKTLRALDVSLPQLADKTNNLNPGELGVPAERAAQWRRWKDNPVFDPQKVDQMVEEGLKRLSLMQLADGGWGWFSGSGESSGVHTTGLVVRGLLQAKDSGVYVNGLMLKNGIAWLIHYQQQQLELLDNVKAAKENCKLYADNHDAFVFRILCDAGIKSDKMEKMRAYLYRDRLQLSVYGQILLALGLQKIGEKTELNMVMQNIREYQESSKEEQTCWLNMEKGSMWWFWYGSRIESMAGYLQLLCRSGSKDDMAVAGGIAKYLVNNRKHATYWDSTRDTAFCVEAICEYLKKSGEFEPDMALSIVFDGKTQKKITINKGNLFSYDSSFILSGKEVTTGEHKVELIREGSGPVFYHAFLSYFSLEKVIPAAGTEAKITRNYYLIKDKMREVQVESQTGASGFTRRADTERIKLTPPFKFNSGDMIEIELIVETQNFYEYMMVEDCKPAGLEAVNVRSGYVNDVYVEYRDRNVNFFLRNMSQGAHSYTYRLRAEIPGEYSALPARVAAMYAPELKGNSEESKVEVRDKAVR